MNEPATPRRSRVMTSVHRPDPAARGSTGLQGLAGAPDHGGSALRLAIIGPGDHDGTWPRHPDRQHNGGLAAHTTVLAHLLAQAGHDVTLVAWSHPIPLRRRGRAGAGPDSWAPPEVPPFPRTVRALAWSRPDTWVRTGRRLRGFDAIIVVHSAPILVPAHLVLLRAAGVGVGAGAGDAAPPPRAIVVAPNVLPHEPVPGDIAMIRSLFARVDAVLVHSPDQARLARDLQASRVSVTEPVHDEPHPRLGRVETPDLSSPWAHYVGAMEALASPHWQAAEQDASEPSLVPSVMTRALDRARQVRQVAQRRRSTLSMTRADLPEWARPSDVLGDGADADEARDWARSYGLPRCADPLAAWSALGALAAIVRLGDDGRRSAVIVDGSGPGSPLSKWARAVGFAPVELDFAARRASAAGLDVDTGSLDVITQLHPNGCDSEDVDEALSQASWALRSGGLICVTLPMGPVTADGAVGPADVRAVLARAHDLGLVLVGDVDGDITTLMRAASEGGRRDDAAYALVRLTFRRR